MKSANVYCIDTEAQFKDLIQHVEEGSFEFFCLDLETDNKQEKLANIYGIGICFQDDEAFYIPIRNKDTNKVWDEYFEKYIYEYINYWCKKYKLIGWNLIYDTLVFEYNSGHKISDTIYSDGILLKHMVDEERPFALKEVAVKYLGEDSDKAQQAMIENIKANGGEVTKENMEMWKCDTDVLADYCGWDVILSYRLFELFQERLYNEGLDKLFYDEEVMPLYREVTIPAKRNGFPISVEHFKNLEVEIKKDISNLEIDIRKDIAPLVEEFEMQLLTKDYPQKRSGGFPKALANLLDVPLPEKNGKTTLAKKEIEKLLYTSNVEQHKDLYKWILGEDSLSVLTLRAAQAHYFFKDNPERTTIFNLKSNDHLSHLLFTVLKEKPLGKTEGGKPQIDDEMIESLIGKYPFIEKLSILKKLNKLHSTYIEGILSRHIKGIIYTSLLQFGTTGGRYSSTNPNLQNLPRVKGEDSEAHPLVLKYANAIREGFVSPTGYKIVDADESSLEPRAFAHCSSDTNLQNIFHTGEDMYSAIAKRMYGLEECSTFKKDKNFLGTLYPEKRQIIKCFSEGAKVETYEGVKNIEDIKIGDKVLTSFGFKAVTNTNSREAETIIFSTNRGFLECTKDHKIWSESEKIFKEAEQFKEGESISHSCTKTLSDAYGFDSGKKTILPVYQGFGKSMPYCSLEFNEDWAYILGSFLGDGVGSYGNRKRRAKTGLNSQMISGMVGLCGLSEDGVLGKWESLVSKYGWNVSTSVSKRGSNKPLTVKRIAKNNFTQLFQQTFKAFRISDLSTLHGHKNLQIQPFVFNSSLNVKLSFIAGLLDTDGYLKNNKTKGYSEVVIVSKSHRLITDLNKLLSDIGVKCATSPEWNKTYKRYYYLLRLTRKGTQKLAELGLHNYLACPRKKDAMSSLLNKRVLYREGQARPPKFLKIIETNKVKPVYDITVEDVHEFMCDNIRVHNCMALAVTYGAEAPRIADLLGIQIKVAQQLIDDYLNAYSGLKGYIETCHISAKTTGTVKTIFGRTRHLPHAKRLYAVHGDKLLDYRYAKFKGLMPERKMFKNALNNSTNMPIQGLAAHVINRASINISREFKKHGIDGYIALQIHDQICCIVKQEQAQQALDIVQYAMENSVSLSVPLVAEPKIADNLRESH